MRTEDAPRGEPGEQRVPALREERRELRRRVRPEEQRVGLERADQVAQHVGHRVALVLVPVDHCVAQLRLPTRQAVQ